MLFESVVTNIIYYWICFVLYITKLWIPLLIGIALMFGIGNALDSVVSFIAYKFLLKKENITLTPINTCKKNNINFKLSVVLCNFTYNTH